MEPNGQPVEPSILVSYDAATQNVNLRLNQEQIKNWAFAAAVLRMAADAADNQHKMEMAIAMQRQAAEAQVAESMRRSLMKH